MNRNQTSPGGRPAAWLYRLTITAAILSGMGQMPIYKRYYLTSIPGLGWAENFYTLSDLHYVAAAVLLALVAWRLALDARCGSGGWSWGPATWWGWTLFGALIVTGALKVAKNAGLFIDPFWFMVIDLAHLGAAMAFIFTGLGVVIARLRKRPAVQAA